MFLQYFWTGEVDKEIDRNGKGSNHSMAHFTWFLKKTFFSQDLARHLFFFIDFCFVQRMIGLNVFEFDQITFWKPQDKFITPDYFRDEKTKHNQ